MEADDIETRLIRAETRIDLLAEHLTPKPKPLLKRLLSLDTLRNLLFLVGLPVTVLLAYQAFDREILNAQKTRDLAQKNIAIERLDRLQDINAEIYRLQTQGDDNIAFALIEAKRGQIARLTDAVYTAWVVQPDMLGRYDLNALAEALLVQGRTDHALAAAQAVDTDTLGPIDRIDQKILNARIQFALGPAHDMEAARDHLRAALPAFEKIEREGQRLLMQEKIMVVRLSNEFWRNAPCDKLAPMAGALAEIHAANKTAGAYQDQFGAQITLEGVTLKCG
jgi:hypothetical protein